MPERGAAPNVHPVLRRVLNLLAAFSSPLLPDDYLEMVNPLWSTRELRGRVEEVKPETGDAATVCIRPGYRWPGHRAGQYVRVGVDIDGVRHWRAYSLTSDPFAADGFIRITPKLVESGKVSPFLVRELRPGTIVTVSDVEGDFTLPETVPDKLLFITAGSGITPVMSMLRQLDHDGAVSDVVLLHSARERDGVIFGDELRALHKRCDGLTLHEQTTGDDGRISPQDLEQLCPDWREREIYISGPADMLDAFDEFIDEHGNCERLHMERFQPKLGLGQGGSDGEGGTIRFLGSDTEAESDGKVPILVAGEEAGLELPYGCREGICHTCVCELRSGRVRDLRNGEVYGQEGEMIRTCISAPEGPIEIDL